MASLPAPKHPRLLTADEFLQIDFGSDLRAELDDGEIRMMAGGTRAHASVQANIIAVLRDRLRGSGCRPYGSDMAVRTHGMSVRYPDVTVDCGTPGDADTDERLNDPRVIFEVLSPSTRNSDLGVKKNEYQALSGVDTIVFADPDTRTLSVSQRTATGWSDTAFGVYDVVLPALSLTIAHADVFARD